MTLSAHNAVFAKFAKKETGNVSYSVWLPLRSVFLRFWPRFTVLGVFDRLEVELTEPRWPRGVGRDTTLCTSCLCCFNDSRVCPTFVLQISHLKCDVWSLSRSVQLLEPHCKSFHRRRFSEKKRKNRIMEMEANTGKRLFRIFLSPVYQYWQWLFYVHQSQYHAFWAYEFEENTCCIPLCCTHHNNSCLLCTASLVAVTKLMKTSG